MSHVPKQKSNDPLVGYFASVMLALLCSSLWGDMLAEFMAQFLPQSSEMPLRLNLSAGLFFAIAFSDPVGAVLRKRRPRRFFLRFGLGFAAGIAIQILFLTPIGGAGMSNFMLLLVAATAVPAMFLTTSVNKFLDSRGILPADQLANAILRILSWPDRVLFVLLMGASYTLFWEFAATPNQVLAVLGTVLVALTLWVTMRHVPEIVDMDPEEVERRAWLALEPEIEIGLIETATARLRNMVQTLLPGAILFGGVMRLAIEFLFIVFPGVSFDLGDPMGSAQTFAMVLASGLAVVLFGMMAALGFSLFVIQIIGKYKGWSQGHLRENYVHMIKAMYFRPLDRA